MKTYTIMGGTVTVLMLVAFGLAKNNNTPKVQPNVTTSKTPPVNNFGSIMADAKTGTSNLPRRHAPRPVEKAYLSGLAKITTVRGSKVILNLGDYDTSAPIAALGYLHYAMLRHPKAIEFVVTCQRLVAMHCDEMYSVYNWHSQTLTSYYGSCGDKKKRGTTLYRVNDKTIHTAATQAQSDGVLNYGNPFKYLLDYGAKLKA